jgi:DNA-dependent RNA polymerase auxiliary subunit epsilon
MTKKKMSLYYDDENTNDIDLIKFIDDARGKSSRNAFIINTLNDLKDKKLTYEKPTQQIILQGTNTIETEKKNIDENKINEQSVNNFKKKFGKG